MNKSISITIILGALIGAAQLTAAEKWEGSDSFDSVAKWKNFVKQGTNGEKGQIFLLGGQVVYSATVPTYDNAACWAWGSTKKWTLIPTGRSWKSTKRLSFPKPRLVRITLTRGLDLPFMRNREEAPIGLCGLVS